MKYTKIAKLSFVISLIVTLSACVPQFSVNMNIQGVQDGMSYIEEIPDISIDYSESYEQALAENKEGLFEEYLSNELSISLNSVDVTSAFDVQDKQAVLIVPSVVNAALHEGNNVLQVSLTPDPKNTFLNLFVQKTAANFTFSSGGGVPSFAVSSVRDTSNGTEIIGYMAEPLLVNEFLINNQEVSVDEETGKFIAQVDSKNQFTFRTVDVQGRSFEKAYNKNISNQIHIRSSIKDTLINQDAVRGLVRENVRGTFDLPPALLNDINPIGGLNILGFGAEANVASPLVIGQSNLLDFSWTDADPASGGVSLRLDLFDLDININARVLLALFHIDLGIKVFIDTLRADVFASFAQREGKLDTELDDLRVTNLTGVRAVILGIIPIGFDFISGGLISFFTSQDFIVNVIVDLVEPRINSLLDDMLGNIVLGLSLDTPIANLQSEVGLLSTMGGKLFVDLITKVEPSSNVKTSLGVLKGPDAVARPSLNTDFGVNISQTLINEVSHALHVSGATDVTIFLNNPLVDLLFIEEQEVNAGDWRVNVQTVLPLEISMNEQNKAGVDLPGMMMSVDIMSRAGEWVPGLSYLLSIAGAADISLSSGGFLALDIDEQSINFNVLNIELLGEEIAFINTLTQTVLSTVIRPVVTSVFSEIGALEFQLPLDNPFVDLTNLTYQTGNGKIIIGSNVGL